MKKLKMHSLDFTDENIAQLAKLFPNCVTEATNADGKLSKAIDFDLLRQELSTDIVEGQKERYHLNWPGKKKALLTANAAIAKTLRPCREQSVNFDQTENLFIEGDNLETLKLLQETYLGKVKMIYIDPPYNTGKDFIYSDKFSVDRDKWKIDSGDYDEQGNRLVSNTESNGRFHSDWLSMMYPRLKLARNLLRDDGVIFISIDDNEQANLKRMCDEIFGEENFIDTICWKKKYGGGAKEKFLVSVHEYILIYSRNKLSFPEILVNFDLKKARKFYKYKDEKYETLGYFRTHPLEAVKSFDIRKNLRFSVTAPDGTQVYPKRQWRWSKEKFDEALKNKEVIFSKNKDDQWVLSSKQYLNHKNGVQRKTKAQSIIDDVFTQDGTKEILELFGDAKIFPFPKPVRLILKLLEIGGLNGDDIILDLFAGSASSANALLKYNQNNRTNCKYIQIQFSELTNKNSEAFKAGYQTIAEISKERIRRAGSKIKQENPKKANKLDVGFRVLRLDSSNMKDVYYSPAEINQDKLFGLVDNIKADRSDEDLLFQVLLDLGLDLTLAITEKIIKHRLVFFVNDNALIACFDQEGKITEGFCKKLTKYQAQRVVFCDSGFKDDSVKINIEQIFKHMSPNTELKTI